MARLPFPRYPKGWFRIAFRGEDGKLGVLDADCLHCGAHRAIGGRVVGHPDWIGYRRLRWKTRTHNQEMAENAVLRVLSTSQMATPRGPIAAFRRWRQHFYTWPAGSPAAAPG